MIEMDETARLLKTRTPKEDKQIKEAMEKARRKNLRNAKEYFKMRK